MEQPVNESRSSTDEFDVVIASTPLTAAPRPSADRSSSSRSPVFIVGLAWLAVAFVAVALNAETIKGFAAQQVGTVLKAADIDVAVPGDPGNEPGSVLCNDVSPSYAARINRGFALMRRTSEGKRLYQELLDNDVCVTVRTLKDWAGLALARGSNATGWEHSTIDIDREHLETVGSDVLATTLVHEATHMDRTIQGTTCEVTDLCTVFDNEVVLEEEVAAHAAEARLWIAFYGRDGKEDPDPVAAWENTLAATYLAGPAVFNEYVANMRVDDPTLTISE